MATFLNSFDCSSKSFFFPNFWLHHPFFCRREWISTLVAFSTKFRCSCMTLKRRKIWNWRLIKLGLVHPKFFNIWVHWPFNEKFSNSQLYKYRFPNIPFYHRIAGLEISTITGILRFHYLINYRNVDYVICLCFLSSSFQVICSLRINLLLCNSYYFLFQWLLCSSKKWPTGFSAW